MDATEAQSKAVVCIPEICHHSTAYNRAAWALLWILPSSWLTPYVLSALPLTFPVETSSPLSFHSLCHVRVANSHRYSCAPLSRRPSFIAFGSGALKLFIMHSCKHTKAERPGERVRISSLSDDTQPVLFLLCSHRTLDDFEADPGRQSYYFICKYFSTSL